MKKLFFIIGIVLPIFGHCQFETFYDPSDSSMYSKGWVSDIILYRIKDHTSAYSPSYYKILTDKFFVSSLDSTHSDGTPTRIAHVSNKGLMKVSDVLTLFPSLSGNSGKFLTNNGSAINWATALTSEVDGSTTNEIELPSMSGQSGKVLSNNGSVSQWITPTSGTVTSVGIVSLDLSISGSPVTTSGNITANLTTTGIGAGDYGIVTVDTKGRVTAGKRQETYSGTTDSNGLYTVTFSNSYAAAPNIQANIIDGTDTQVIRTTAISTTGFTVLVRNRTDFAGLLPTWSNVNGASVDILITEK